MSRQVKASKIKSSDRVFYTVVGVIVALVLVSVLYPLIYVISSSFSSGTAVTLGKVVLWPVDLSVQGYKIVFSTKDIWIGYRNSIFFTIVGSALCVMMTVMTAYPLSRRDFQGKKFFDIYFLIPMFFSGGLIPSYILRSKLGMVDNAWGYLVLLGGVNIYNMILVRNYFQSSIPHELLEAARVDGISDAGYFLKIAIPLAKPVFSVIALYTVVSAWNDYMNPLIYLRSMNLQTLQLVVRQIMEKATIRAESSSVSKEQLMLAQNVDVMKYALIVVATVPMMMIYPFVMKFFEKGVMMGSVKG